MELQTELLSGFATAIGIGLLIGTVRENLHNAQTLTSGIRTHALLAVIASAAMSISGTAFLVTFAIVGALVVVAYRHNMQADPGMTGEVSLLATAMLSARNSVSRCSCASSGTSDVVLRPAGARHAPEQVSKSGPFRPSWICCPGLSAHLEIQGAECIMLMDWTRPALSHVTPPQSQWWMGVPGSQPTVAALQAAFWAAKARRCLCMMAAAATQ